MVRIVARDLQSHGSSIEHGDDEQDDSHDGYEDGDDTDRRTGHGRVFGSQAAHVAMILGPCEQQSGQSESHHRNAELLRSDDVISFRCFRDIESEEFVGGEAERDQ